jgi:phospholipid/cholesterol/gamma-HCH transport system ATP-binding protein
VNPKGFTQASPERLILQKPATPAFVLSHMTLPNNPLLVELKNLSFGYGDRVILNDISFGIPRGKVTALMGVSGGGKTTVLRLIGGQYQAQKGALTFDGQDVGQMNTQQLYAARRRMGMLFQFGALFTDMNVFDNVAFPLREHTKMSEIMIRDIVLMKLDAVGLRGARNLKPSEISGGMGPPRCLGPCHCPRPRPHDVRRALCRFGPNFFGDRSQAHP